MLVLSKLYYEKYSLKIELNIQQFFYKLWVMLGNGRQTMMFEEDRVFNKNVNAMS